MEADAWATAFMVAGQHKSTTWAERFGLTAVFVHRDGANIRQKHIGESR
jgi:thiamine biosynthesis lipoprotein